MAHGGGRRVGDPDPASGRPPRAEGAQGPAPQHQGVCRYRKRPLRRAGEGAAPVLVAAPGGECGGEVDVPAVRGPGRERPRAGQRGRAPRLGLPAVGGDERAHRDPLRPPDRGRALCGGDGRGPLRPRDPRGRDGVPPDGALDRAERGDDIRTCREGRPARAAAEPDRPELRPRLRLRRDAGVDRRPEGYHPGVGQAGFRQRQAAVRPAGAADRPRGARQAARGRRPLQLPEHPRASSTARYASSSASASNRSSPAWEGLPPATPVGSRSTTCGSRSAT